jgi:membrane-associated protein
MLAAVLADVFNTEERLRSFGTLATFVVFGIIFAESGLMIGFFLPGDSLLFTAGLLSVSNTHIAPLPVLIIGCAIAAIAGDQVGYAFGQKVGPPLFSRPDSRFFKQKHLKQAEAFFERHGSKTIILARFTPIVRTFAPIVAGASSMKYRTFVIYNVIGGIGWTTLMLGLGAALGKTFPSIGKNLDYVIVVIVALSLVPFGIEYLRHRRRGAAGDAADAAAAAEFEAEAAAAAAAAPADDATA